MAPQENPDTPLCQGHPLGYYPAQRLRSFSGVVRFIGAAEPNKDKQAQAGMVFEDYVRAAEATAVRIGAHDPTDKGHPLLNGAPYQIFRSEIALEKRREEGAFFSSPALGAYLVGRLNQLVSPDARIMDPTCGMGDLLLAYAATLPIEDTLQATLALWGERLAGIERREDLARLSRARLVVLARTRGGFFDEGPDLGSVFPHIVVGDALNSDDALAQAGGFLFNPPFAKVAAPKGLKWSSGQVNASAVFLERLVKIRSPNAPIAAVLPEVLRCGSRYSRFRDHLSALPVQGDYCAFGRFDPWTDVDVFCSVLTSGPGGLWGTVNSQPQAAGSIGDSFEVRVGTVVPHRHPETGPVRPYVCAKTTPAWAEGFSPTVSRAFDGRVFQPPFVVVRRTSSPSDRMRAVGSIVIGDAPVAVENHLIVLEPRVGGLEMCHRLIAVLKNPAITRYLNAAIRCRHLTTTAVKCMPFGSLE